ncbi:hypothetical protein XJ18_17970 [Bacillus pumilus]|uniref:hypothetical protein n=1 Tax=Bacillus TaxID=1386 RepID=UPI00064022A9|nr:hypothetical protein [Bacillus pumilus]KLK98110.1 hypothetical protein XJ18_17970 [Bacillus pumilus]
MENSNGTIQRYSREISKITNKLKELKNDKIYELTNNRSDGSLYTNAMQIEEYLNDLLIKIETDAPSINEQLREAMNKVYKSND